MTSRSLNLLSFGMATPVGWSASATCAAIRCGINSARETSFTDASGQFIVANEVDVDIQLRGSGKLGKLLAAAIDDCMSSYPNVSLSDVPLLLGVAEDSRQGMPSHIPGESFHKAQAELGATFRSDSRLIRKGRVSCGIAIELARRLLYGSEAEYVLIAGVDSLLFAETLKSFENRDRLLTSSNSDGFIAGEAAGAMLVSRSDNKMVARTRCIGVGAGTEVATIESDEPLRADGLVSAVRSALEEARIGFDGVNLRLADVSGEQYGFKEATLVVSRLMRVRKERLDIWHPADCIGETGAAVGPILLGVFDAAVAKGYAPGRIALCHFSADSGERIAVVVSSVSAGGARG